MRTIDTSALTSAELQHLGIEALIARLGHEGTLRFLANLRRGQGDYLQVQDTVFGEMTVEQIHDDAMEYEQAHPEVMEGKEVL